jgi:hypothetical protein
VENKCRLLCEQDSDCPDLLKCFSDEEVEDEEKACSLPRDPFGELNLITDPENPELCERGQCDQHTTQEQCESTLNAATHHIVDPCIWVEERIFHDNAASCEEVSVVSRCQNGIFSPGGQDPDSGCQGEGHRRWVDHGAGTVSLITTSQCNYDTSPDPYSDDRCDPNDPTRPAVCDCACE